ncbi:MAG: methylmalonyl Co-A mutase-associated GTPase MeaB [Sphingobacteriia bacterium]|nr:MAG: methylmalonyl Co-A mutase-associated GTPase MeaB [Sphingobacteriia bacterium]
MFPWSTTQQEMKAGSVKALARLLSAVENEVAGYLDFLAQLQPGKAPLIGITGPPGAGKSTLTDALIDHWVGEDQKLAVLCVDPSSPFNLGALLGDRIRMSSWYNHPQVYIRSLATRGALGGLHPQIMEMVAVLQAAGFDRVLVETVGVGQSEVEIAGLADATVVVLVPEGGDEVQTMKAGLMEIADLFVVNKADRPGSAKFVTHLKQMMAPAFLRNHALPILTTVAAEKQGMAELAAAIDQHLSSTATKERRAWLLAERAYLGLQKERMKNISKIELKNKVQAALDQPGFHFYAFLHTLLHG